MAKTEYNDISQEEGVVQKADGGEMNDAGQKLSLIHIYSFRHF